jgi:hypothetical protein
VPGWFWGGGLALLLAGGVGVGFLVLVASFVLSGHETRSAPRASSVSSSSAVVTASGSHDGSAVAGTSCASSSWVGDYQLTTLVTGSSNGNEGVNGFYTLALTPLSPPTCDGLAFDIQKIGYGKGRVQADQQQWGSGVLRLMDTDTATIGLEMRSSAAPIPMRFLLRRTGAGRLDGIWQYTGRSWSSNGFWGIFVASSGGRSVPSGPEALTADTQALYYACGVDPASGPTCIPRD